MQSRLPSLNENRIDSALDRGAFVAVPMPVLAFTGSVGFQCPIYQWAYEQAQKSLEHARYTRDLFAIMN